MKFRIGAACLWIAGLSLGVQADPCVFTQPYQSAKVGEAVRFALQCQDGLAPQVAWDFGDDTPQTDFGAELAASHSFAAPGIYSVFARIKGEDIPISASVSVVETPTAIAPTHSATLVFEPRRRRVYAVNPDHGTVAAIQVEGLKREFEAPVGKNPRTLALDGDGQLWVACQDDATLHVISGMDGSSVAVIKLPFGSRPYGIAFAPDRKTAYVSLEAMGDLLKIDALTRTVTATLALGPTPRGIAVSHDGKRIFVTRHISRTGPPGAKDYGEVWEVDGGGFTLARTFRLDTDESPDGATTGRGVPNGITSIAISPDGKFALVPATKANTVKGVALDSTVPDFQTTTRSMLMKLDLVGNREDRTARKDVDNRSIPSSISFDSQGRYAFLTTEGTNKTPILLAHNLGDFSAVVPPDVSADSLLRGEAAELAPIGSVVDDKDSLLFVHNFLSRDIGVYDFSGRSGSPPKVARIPTSASEPLPAQVLLGKRVFYNAADLRMSKDGYLSCVVCHIDGAHDGRIWDFTHKGEGLRRTTDLRGRVAAGGPLHWSANFDEIQDFEHDIRGAFSGEGFLSNAHWASGTRNKTLGDKKAGLSPELDALAAYVASLTRVPPSPFRNDNGSMTEAGKRGREVFSREDVGCAKCHSAPAFTDSRLPTASMPMAAGPVSVFAGTASYRTSEGFVLHDVGTMGAQSGQRMSDSLRGLDTPTLKGIWTGGPYLHDGSATTLMDVIETKNPDDKHGKTSHLTAQEKEDLLAYLRQIDDLDDQGQMASVRQSGRKTKSGEAVSLSASVTPQGRGTGVLIRFQLPPRMVQRDIRILNSQGQIVASHRIEKGNPSGQWHWNGKQGNGHIIGAGLYHVQISQPGSSNASASFIWK